MEAELAPETLP